MSRAEVDLKEYTAALNKAKQVDPNDSACLDILQNIATIPESAITLEILKSTKCGKIINSLKKVTTNSAIKTLAIQLLTMMKKAASAQGYTKKPTAGAAPPAASAAASGSVSIKLAASSTTTASATASTTSTSSTSSTSSNSTNTSTTTTATNNNIPGLRSTGNATRDFSQKKMLLVLKVPVQGEENDWPTEEELGVVAVTLEDCMNSQSPADVRPRDYMVMVKRLSFNLGNNDELRGRLAHGLMPPYVLVMLDPKELATKDVKKMREEAGEFDKGTRRSNWKQAHAKEMAIAAGVKNVGISMYQCPRCQSKNVDSFAMQTRGADEPMTIFCTCLDCMKAFRGGSNPGSD